MSRRVEQVAGGVNGHEEVAQRGASLPTISLARGRQSAASLLDVTRDTL